jgi:hypothetical protein
LKKAISALLALALCLGLCIPVSAAETFTDVEGGWAAPYIERAASLGLVRGVGEGRYAPEKEVSYCEYAVMLCGIRYQDEAARAAAGNTGAWWLPYCVVADNHGLWDSTVMADRQAWDSQSGQPVPRQSMAQMMYNYLQAEKKQLPSEVDKAWARMEISDLDAITGRNRDAVLTCYSMKLLSGTGGGFDPSATMNRAQAAATLCSLYDAVTDGADRPAQTGARLANGKEITQDNVREILNGLRSTYPEGMPWTNESNEYTSKTLYISGKGCSAFAFLCSDKVFGDLPLTAVHSNFDRLRAGDILRVQNDTHTVVVLEKRADSVIVTEGNFDAAIHWDREITRRELEEENFYARTRYPL